MGWFSVLIGIIVHSLWSKRHLILWHEYLRRRKMTPTLRVYFLRKIYRDKILWLLGKSRIMWSEEAFKLLDYPRDILGKGPHTAGPHPPQKMTRILSSNFRFWIDLKPYIMKKHNSPLALISPAPSSPTQLRLRLPKWMKIVETFVFNQFAIKI